MEGGDIKLIEACSFYLGLSERLIGSTLGLAFGIFISMLYFRYMRLNYNGEFALVPYLAANI